MDNIAEARLWLRECRDRDECHETRSELLEWSIVVLIVVEIVIGVVGLFHRD